MLVPSFSAMLKVRLLAELSPRAVVLLVCTAEVSVCAWASWVTLMVYLPATTVPDVVALKALELLVADVAVNKSALLSAVFAVWKVESELFSVAYALSLAVYAVC